ncbi:kinase-like domain-containing protein [Rhizophagus clarus]|uniref:Kinase-like domain-containing protein n=1 Tax=Rhizophagus clarus TaxID=94130 RepID=A0A8H3R402_9GLOM|nr:kinase-like domain-containing protein [Rhizophagus clarus]
MYGANWIDGSINEWDEYSQNWKRLDQNMFVTLKRLYNPKNIKLEFMNEINRPYGITQDPQTKNYIMVLNNKCKKCNSICNVIHFQRNFKNWTSDNDYIDKLIQDTQLSAHFDTKEVLEWIPYDRFKNITHPKYSAEGKANWIDGFNNIKYSAKEKVYSANWIDGYIYERGKYSQNWKRCNQNMFITLKRLYDPKNIKLEFINKINRSYGITQNPQTKHYMMVFEVLEWIPYDRVDNIRYIEEIGIYRAHWIDGCIDKWDDENQNWKRFNQNMVVTLKRLCDPKNIKLEFINEINGSYGITQDPKTKHYMMVLSCLGYNNIFNAIHFQENFEYWTSGNDDINKFIQDTQLSAYNDMKEVLEWIPYDKFNNIKYSAERKAYRANWIDGFINEWDEFSQSWKRLDQNIEWGEFSQSWERLDQNMFVTLKRLNNSKNIKLEFINEINRPYGITQDPETKIYMMLSAHLDTNKVLEWIPYDRFYDVNYIASGGFSKVYKAIWIDKDIPVALKILNNSKNITLEFMNEITLHNRFDNSENINYIVKFYGITQNPETKDYIMVLKYAEDGSLRNYLNANYNKLNWNKMINYLFKIALGLTWIHNNGFIHRDFHRLRPRFNTKVPQLIVQMIKRCLDADLLNRPKAEEIKDILYNWQYNGGDSQSAELQRQIEEADIINDNLSKNNVPQTNLGISYNTHSEAIYMSRLLSFNNLPKPKNFDDYYECSDNIISIKSSASLLQINASRLNIDDNNLELLNNTDENNESLEYSESLQIDISQLNTDENEKL